MRRQTSRAHAAFRWRHRWNSFRNAYGPTSDAPSNYVYTIHNHKCDEASSRGDGTDYADRTALRTKGTFVFRMDDSKLTLPAIRGETGIVCDRPGNSLPSEVLE